MDDESRRDPSVGRAYKTLADRHSGTLESGLFAVILFLLLFALVYGVGGSLADKASRSTGALPIVTMVPIPSGGALSKASATATAQVALMEDWLVESRELMDRAKRLLENGEMTAASNTAYTAVLSYELVIDQGHKVGIPYYAPAYYEWGLAHELLGDIRVDRDEYRGAEAKVREALQYATLNSNQVLVHEAQAALTRIQAKLARDR